MNLKEETLATMCAAPKCATPKPAIKDSIVDTTDAILAANSVAKNIAEFINTGSVSNDTERDMTEDLASNSAFNAMKAKELLEILNRIAVMLGC